MIEASILVGGGIFLWVLWKFGLSDEAQSKDDRNRVRFKDADDLYKRWRDGGG